MVIFLTCFLSFFSLFPSRFSTLAFLCVWTFSCLFPFLSFLLFTPLCIFVSQSLFPSVFFCYYLLLQTLCIIRCFCLICSCCHTFLTSLCAFLLRILSFVFVFPPLSCAFFCLPFYLSRILFLYHFLCLHPLLVCLFLSSLSFP